MKIETSIPDEFVADAAAGARFDPSHGLTHQQWIAAATANFARSLVVAGASQRAAVEVRSNLAAQEQLTPISATITQAAQSAPVIPS